MQANRCDAAYMPAERFKRMGFQQGRRNRVPGASGSRHHSREDRLSRFHN